MSDKTNAVTPQEKNVKDSLMRTKRGSRNAYPSIIVVGAGFGGITLALRLKRFGFKNILIVEKGDGVGGVWRENTYPGAACDVPSPLYSISSAPNRAWSRRYAEQNEILSYLRRVAEQHELQQMLRTHTEVAEAVFDESTNKWRLTTTTHETLECDIFISAVGQLSRPSVPAIAGISSFKGPAFHSAQWDHGLELRGKRIAVIGTGASAIQFVPILAETAKQLVVFQRSAPWVLPKFDQVYSRRHQRLWQTIPILRLSERLTVWIVFELLALALVDAKPIGRLLEAVARVHLRRGVPDKSLRSLLTPDYTPGCKRVLFSNDYYRAIGRSNVSLETGAIAAVEPDGIRTVDGQVHAADVIVYGTGFSASEFLSPMKIYGRGGRALSDVWADVARAYYGVAVPDFPNFFMMYGPNTNVGSGSIVYMLEAQAKHIVALLSRFVTDPHQAIEVRPAVEERFNRRLRHRLEKSVWTLCASWYRSERGSIPTNWPGPTFWYRLGTRRPSLDAYLVSKPATVATRDERFEEVDARGERR